MTCNTSKNSSSRWRKCVLDWFFIRENQLAGHTVRLSLSSYTSSEFLYAGFKDPDAVVTLSSARYRMGSMFVIGRAIRALSTG